LHRDDGVFDVGFCAGLIYAGLFGGGICCITRELGTWLGELGR